MPKRKTLILFQSLTKYNQRAAVKEVEVNRGLRNSHECYFDSCH